MGVRKANRLFIVAMDNQSSTTARVRQIIDHPQFLFQAEILFWPYKIYKNDFIQLSSQLKRGVEWAEIILLHRVIFPAEIQKWFFSLRKPVVYDFDDAIYAVPSSTLHEENRTVTGWIKRRIRQLIRGQPDYAARYKPLVDTLQRVNSVSAGNPDLARFACQFSSQVAIIPTAVDVENFPIKQHHCQSPVNIGWYGSPDNQWYFDTINPALRKIDERFQGRTNFQVISSSPYYTKDFLIEWIPWKRESELQDLLSFDIGLMPLTDDAWARGKSGNKAIYYMGLGIPAIVTPVGVNKEIVINGQTGFHASTTSEWIDSISNLVQNAELRQKMGSKGRERVMAKFSRVVAVHLLNELLQKTLDDG